MRWQTLVFHIPRRLVICDIFLNVANHTRRSRFLLRRIKDFVWFCPRLLVGTSLSARPCRVSQCESDQAGLEVFKKPWVPVDWDFVESGQQTLDTSSMAEPANGVCIVQQIFSTPWCLGKPQNLQIFLCRLATGVNPHLVTATTVTTA